MSLHAQCKQKERAEPCVWDLVQRNRRIPVEIWSEVRLGERLSLELAQQDSTSTEQLTASSKVTRPWKEVSLGTRSETFHFQRPGFVSHLHRSSEITTEEADH